jgi:ferredoxin
MKVRVDQSRCMAIGMCTHHAPGLFDQRDSDGVVVVVHEVPPEDQMDALMNAVRSCPMQVISLEP